MSRASHLDRCARCLLRYAQCLCAVIPCVETRTRIVLVRHARERSKVSGSGRLLALALPGLALVDHALPDRSSSPNVEAALAHAAELGAWLLWPEGPTFEERNEPPPRCLVVVDGTWAQARRMRSRLSGLRQLPCLALRTSIERPRLRQAPSPAQLSTLEALAQALSVLEGSAVGAPLAALYDEFCARALPSSRQPPAPRGASPR